MPSSYSNPIALDRQANPVHRRLADAEVRLGEVANGVESETEDDHRAEAGERPPQVAAQILQVVPIPKGTFKMGSPVGESRGEDELLHDVEITQAFYMGAYEVTQSQYRKVMEINPDPDHPPTPSWFSRTGPRKDQVAGKDTDDFPVETVNWKNAVEFCKQLSALPKEQDAGRVYHLPTEAEWEYACRGGAPSSTPFHYGNSLSPDQANFNNKLGRTAKVGSYQPNAFGLYDMHGNVWEWCHDWYNKDYYKNSPKQDPKGPDSGPESRRVLRGGSWTNVGQGCRTAQRLWFEPGSRGDFHGFRVVVRPGVRTP